MIAPAILFFLAAFVVVFLIVRWHNIVVPLRQLTMAQIEGVRRRLNDAVLKTGDRVEGKREESCQHVPECARELLNKAACEVEACWPIGSPLDFLFWPRGSELRAWRMIHEAERLIALNMDPELARERLRAISVPQGGKQESSSGSAKLQEIIRALEFPGGLKPEDIRARLFWELGRYYDEEDTKFARLSVNHAKVSWLIGVGLLLIVALLLAQQSLASRVLVLGEMQWWMLFGAIGATLRRMTAALKPQERSTDYGFYWTVLFLSPVFGALAGVAVLLLLYAATVLGVLEQNLLFSGDRFIARLGVAGLSGLSEKLIDRLAEQVEGKLLPKDNGEEKEEPGKDSQEGKRGKSPRSAQNQESPGTVTPRAR